MQYVMGNRDSGTATEHPAAGRLARTVNNSMEAAVLFVPLVFASQVLGTSNALTQYGAVAFVAARLAYAVLYPLGIVGLRTLVWNVGLASLAAMAAGLLVA
ncbi:MAG: MAPEG family protein, partial [Pseudomonadota bacterium]